MNMKKITINDVDFIFIEEKGTIILETVVTEEQWKAVFPNYEWEMGPNYPKVNVTYYEIEDFLNKINDMIEDHIIDLPTKEDYDNISDTTFDGDPTKVVCWENTKGIMPEVKTMPANKYGIYDFPGTVWEAEKMSDENE